MTLNLTHNGTKIVIAIDDKTTTVYFDDNKKARGFVYRYVPTDIFDFVVDVKSQIGGECSESESQFVLHQRVRHKEYGDGTIIAKMSEEDYYGVEFDKPKGYCHQCTGWNIVWGHTGTKSTCSWVRPENLLPIGPRETKSACEALLDYMKEKEEMNNQ